MKKLNKLFITLGLLSTVLVAPMIAASCNKTNQNQEQKPQVDNKTKIQIPEFKSKFEFRKYYGDNVSSPLYKMVKYFNANDKVDVSKVQTLLKTFVELMKNKEYGVNAEKLNYFTAGLNFEENYNGKNYSQSMVELLKQQGNWNKEFSWERGDFDKIIFPIANGSQKEVDFITMARILKYIVDLGIQYGF
ncbi:variable surface lipoprotein [Mycoplasma sp. 3137]|uniref:variable surface lipoprotein n=1 Tax=Mycoplasma sp. 3137 TaxID=3401687 RepID=UPI003AB01DB5